MKSFDCVAARDERHALALLAEYGSAARVLAGGTDLTVELKAATNVPRVLIDVSRLDGLKRIAAGASGLHIGGLVTHSALARSVTIAACCPVLAEAARSIGAVQTRNMGTVAGNLVSAVPSMDTGPALLALDASVVLASARGVRRLELSEFLLGPRRTALESDELLTEIIVPAAALGKPLAFLKFGLRKGQALALVNVAAGFFARGAAFRDVRVALGAVAPTVMRARRSERFLEGATITSSAIDEAAAIAAQEAAPITDFRASAGYRRTLIEVLTRRALERALRSTSANETEESVCRF